MSKRAREEYGGSGGRDAGGLGQPGIGLARSSGGGSWSAEYHTVLLLKASEFAKVIGRQGKIVNELRQRTGAHIKGIDLVGEDRMVTIGGTGTQIEDAFEVPPPPTLLLLPLLLLLLLLLMSMLMLMLFLMLPILLLLLLDFDLDQRR